MTPSKAYLVGLTGGIASGKTTLARALAGAGAPVIDADRIASTLTGAGGQALPGIRQAFGDQVFNGDSLNRRALADRIFADSAARQRLDALMHPLILQQVERQRQELAGHGVLILDAALLFEAGWDSLCDEVWCAYVPPCVQLWRLMRRDGLSLAKALQRMRSQMPSREKRRRADHSISTWGSRGHNADKALGLWREAKRRAEHAGTSS